MTTRIDRRRVRTPTIMQMEAVECGAASLAMVLAHFGRWVPLADLRRACGVGRDGLSALAVAQGARANGLLCEGRRVEPEDVRGLPLPQVLWWQLSHFVVLEGWDEHGWWLNDPAVGHRWASDDEFGRCFTGVTLTMEPGPHFAEAGHRPVPWRGLAPRLTGSGALIALVLLAGAVLLVPTLLAPMLVRVFVDGFLVDGGRAGFVREVIVVLATAALAQVLLSQAQMRLTTVLQGRISARMSVVSFVHVLGLPMRFFGQRTPADLANRMGLNDQVAQMLSGQLTRVLLAVGMAVAYLIAAFLVSPVLAIVCVAATALQVLVSWTSVRRTREVSRRALSQSVDLQVAMLSTISLVETVKASGTEDQALDRLGAAHDRLIDSEQHEDVSLIPLGVLPQALAQLATVALLAVGGWLAMNGHTTLGTIVAMQVILAGVSGAALQVTSVAASLPVLRASIDRLDDVLDYHADTAQVASETPPAELHGRVDVDAVSFTFDGGDTPFIKNVTVALEPGQHVALVGPSGSGKSTLGRIIAGLLPAGSGAVRYDRVPVADIGRAQLADGLAVVAQDVVLFPGSIMDNIRFWDSTISHATAIQAAVDAGIHEAILRRPGGYQAVLGERGQGLSGGERQRIALARALAREPRVVILDEATSALDTVSEQHVIAAIRRRGCTAVVIAHRLSTIRTADHIVLLRAGEVLEQGTHDELMALDGQYAALVSKEQG